jgi:hypothetical protein
VHKDIKDCNYVFLRQDAVRRALEPPPPIQRPLPGPLTAGEDFSNLRARQVRYRVGRMYVPSEHCSACRYITVLQR